MPTIAPPKTVWVTVLSSLILLGGGGYLWHRNATVSLPPRSRVTVEIGNARLLVPVAWLRSSQQRADGPAARLDLALTWPDFEPLPPKTLDQAAQPPIVFIAVEAAEDGLDPALRPKDLYARFLAPDVEEGPGALIHRTFKATSPYGGESLDFAPPLGEIFAARCLRSKSVETPAARCLWQFRYQTLDVQVRFAPDLLPDWERLNDGVRQAVQRITIER